MSKHLVKDEADKMFAIYKEGYESHKNHEEPSPTTKALFRDIATLMEDNKTRYTAINKTMIEMEKKPLWERIMNMVLKVIGVTAALFVAYQVYMNGNQLVEVVSYFNLLNANI